MRPLHSFLLLAVVIALIGGTWFTLREVEPAAPAVAPASATPAGMLEPEAPEVVAVAPGETRQRPETQPLEATPGDRPVAQAEPKAGNALRGLILDASGAPVEGALVLVGQGLGGLPLDQMVLNSPFSAGLSEAYTDAKGRFELRNKSAGAISLAVRAAGFAPYDKDNVIVPAGGDHELDPIELEPSVILTGRVVDPDGRAIAGADLTRIQPTGATVLWGGSNGVGANRSRAVAATTGPDGSFTIDQLAAGAFRLRVEHEDHPDLVESGQTEGPGSRLDGLTLVMDHGMTIAGRISGAPADVSDLLVRASPERGSRALALDDGEFPPEMRLAEPGEDGSFIVRGVRADHAYNLAVRRTSQRTGLSGLLGSSLSPQVLATAGDRGVELPYQPSGALAFQVVDATTRAPVTEFEARAGVSFMMPLTSDDGRMLKEHPDGRARFGNLRPGPEDRVKLAISAVGYKELELDDLRVNIGEETDLGMLALESVPVVEITVLDDATGSPVPGARVTLAEYSPNGGGMEGMRIDITAGAGDGGEVVINDGSQSATTDSEGIARLSSLSGTEVTYSVSHPDFAPLESRPFISPLGAKDTHIARLYQGGSVTVTMETPDGEPLGGARVEHKAPSDDGDLNFGFNQGEHITDSEGRVTFAHLEEGIHRFRPAGSEDVMGFMGGGAGVVRMRRSGGGPGGLGAPQDDGWRDVTVAEGGSHELLLVAPLKVSIAGTIFEGDRPLEGAEVSLVDAASSADPLMSMFGGGGPKTRADGRGNYTLENVESGDYLLEIRHPSRRMPASFELTVLNEDLRRDYDLDVAIIRGRVVNQEGEGIAGVRVVPELAGESQRPRAMSISVMAFSDSDGGGEVVSVGDGSLGETNAVTDEGGYYELRGVRSGVQLVVRAEGDSVQPGQSEPVELDPNQERSNVDLELLAAGRIEVVAFTGKGTPGRNLVVTASFEGEGEVAPKSGFIQQSGRTTLDGLTPGAWRVTVRSIGQLSGDGATGEEQLVEVLMGETATATFTVP